MKFLLIFTKKSVPEWKECYYDYANIKSLVILCKKGYAIKCNIEDLAREDNYSIQQTAILMQNRDALNHIRSTKTDKIYEIMNQTNCIFYKYHSLSKRVVFLFCQFKIHQLNARLDKYQKWEPLVDQTKEDLLQLLANCYAENIKLQTMTQLHLEAYEKVFKKHEKAFKLFGLNSPSLNSARMARTLSDLERYGVKVESTLDSYQEVVNRENKFKLDEQIQPSPFRVSVISYLFGLFNGFSICVLITSIILLGINIGNYHQENSDQRILLRNQFRLWKGNGLIILYIWVFGISFYIFERKRINYNLIFDYNSKTKKSTARLGFATFVTIIWCSFFIFYVMDLIGIYEVADVENPPVPITIFFPIIIFGIFLVSIAVEFWRNKKDIMFVLFTVLKILLTPFGFFTISFSVIWATQQITSLVQIMFDLSYSVCYYSRTLKNATINPDPCLGITIMVEIIIIILYAIRLLQCIRLALKNQTFLGTRQMYRFIRAALQLVLASISLSSDENNKGYLWAWIPIASVCGLYSFLIDTFLDFNLYLIENDEQGKIKIVTRPQNIFSIHIIRVLVVLNFIFRYNFLLTISPRIIFTYIPKPELIITIASVVELLRRLIWNLLRVENQQIKNNFFFQIRTDYEDRQRRIIKQLKQKGIEWAAEPAALQERNVKQLETLREYILEKNKMQEKVMQFHAKNDKILQDLQESAESEIGKLVAQ